MASEPRVPRWQEQEQRPADGQPALEETELVRVDVRDDRETGDRVVETWNYRRGGYTELKRWSP